MGRDDIPALTVGRLVSREIILSCSSNLLINVSQPPRKYVPSAIFQIASRYYKLYLNPTIKTGNTVQFVLQRVFVFIFTWFVL